MWAVSLWQAVLFIMFLIVQIGKRRKSLIFRIVPIVPNVPGK